MSNIDLHEVVEKRSPKVWAQKVERQIHAGGPNRFIISCGSPITPDTPPERLAELVYAGKGVRDASEWPQLQNQRACV